MRMEDRLIRFMIPLVGLSMAFTQADASELDFTTPTIAGQPVVVVQVNSGLEGDRSDTVVTLENRSARSVKEVWLVLAGHDCKKKPGWPTIRYSSIDGRKPKPPIEPKSKADMRIAKEAVRQVRAVAEKTCGRRIPSEVVVDIVEFTDGDRWTLSEAVRHGGRPESAPVR
jgi:hypothetical protein